MGMTWAFEVQSMPIECACHVHFMTCALMLISCAWVGGACNAHTMGTVAMRIGTDHAHKCPYHEHFMTWALMRITFRSISGPFHAHIMRGAFHAQKRSQEVDFG